MDDAAIVSRLMTGDRTLLLEDGNTASAKRSHGFQCRGQADNTAADDDEIELQVHGVDNTMTE